MDEPFQAIMKQGIRAGPAKPSPGIGEGGLFFSWVSPLLRRGAGGQLQFSDLFGLPRDLRPGHCQQQLSFAWLKVRFGRASTGTLSAQLIFTEAH